MRSSRLQPKQARWDVAKQLRDCRAKREVLQASGGPVVEQEGSCERDLELSEPGQVDVAGAARSRPGPVTPSSCAR